MKKAMLYSLVGAGAAVAATPLLTSAHAAPQTQPDRAPKSCEDRVAVIRDRLQNAPEKHAETRERMTAKLEERLANIPEDKREEARARFEEMHAKHAERAEEMKAKAAEILARLDGVCSKGEEEQRAVFAELRTMHPGPKMQKPGKGHGFGFSQGMSWRMRGETAR